MLQAFLIGNIGADAQVKNKDGREFVAFRVAHNEAYTGTDGQRIERSQWIDCVMGCAAGRPAVLPYLKAGTQVCVWGSMSTRVYSSEKDRCYKAGVTISVARVELLSSSSDPVPRRLYDTAGAMHDVTKFYHVDLKGVQMLDGHARPYIVDENGWVTPKQEENAPTQEEKTSEDVEVY